jgi:hypothetical protein
MKKMLMSGVAVIALAIPASLYPPQAHAFDVEWCENCSTSVQQAQQMATQVQEFAQQINQMVEDYQQYVAIFGQLKAMLNPNTIAEQLFGDQNPLPDIGQLTSVFQGGALNPGALANLAKQFLNSDTIYRPPGGDFTATQINNSAASLANVQALADQSLQSIEDHITGLQQLRSELSDVSSQADLTAIQGRIQSEQADLTAQGTQAQALQTEMLAQQEVVQQQQQQEARQNADQFFNDTSPLGGGLGGAIGDGGVPDFVEAGE